MPVEKFYVVIRHGEANSFDTITYDADHHVVRCSKGVDKIYAVAFIRACKHNGLTSLPGSVTAPFSDPAPQPTKHSVIDRITNIFKKPTTETKTDD